MTAKRKPPASTRRRISLQPDTVERDLVRLALSVVELLRQLMERQALRRIDGGDLTRTEEERLGLMLMRLEDGMARLRDRFGLTLDDLRLLDSVLG